MNLDGAETPYKSADIYAGIQLSPDGNYVMISTIKKPFSYIVPLSRFPMTAQVFDLQGNLVKEWSSAKEATDYLGVKEGNLSKNLKNKAKTAYGHIWKYKKDL